MLHNCNNASGGSTDAVTVTNFVFDDGNYDVASHESICLIGAPLPAQGVRFCLSNGVILQKNGSNIVYIKNGWACTLTGVNMSQSAEALTCLYLDGTTNLCAVNGCVLYGATSLYAGSSTANNKGMNIYTGTVTNLGSGNTFS